MWQITIGYVGHFLLELLSNLETRDLKIYLRLILVIFEICQFKNDDSSITFWYIYKGLKHTYYWGIASRITWGVANCVIILNFHIYHCWAVYWEIFWQFSRCQKSLVKIFGHLYFEFWATNWQKSVKFCNPDEYFFVFLRGLTSFWIMDDWVIFVIWWAVNKACIYG